MVKRNVVVIAYDIKKDTTRSKVSKYLEQHGIRVNYSVFECLLTDRQLQSTIREIGKLMNPSTDTILFYALCQACFVKQVRLGEKKDWNDDTVLSI